MLGTGGATGIAWEIGVLAGLADGGIDMEPDLVVGTSAGALVAARITSGRSVGELYAEVVTGSQPLGRSGLRAVSRLLAAQLYPSRRHALAWLGRRAADSWTRVGEQSWLAQLAPDLSGHAWPESLVIVAVDATTGRPAYFSARQPTDLARAVAASCALPGVFPAVRIDGRLHFDGGLRSPANIDAAVGAETVIALAPLAGSVRAHRRPSVQAKVMSTRAGVALLTPDAASRRAIGPDLLDSRRAARVAAAGRSQGRALADRLGGTWPHPPPAARL